MASNLKTAIQNIILGTLLVTPLAVPTSLAAKPAPPPTASGPIDIQAEQQEFIGDEVLAKGNVKVTYKGSVVYAPVAHLFRDAGGNPQRAIFNGHPRLVQSDSKIDADNITFEIANSRIIADGRAHSEVVTNGPSNGGGQQNSAGGTATVGGTVAGSNAGSGGGNAATGSAATAGLDASNGLPGSKASDKSSEKIEKIITDSDHQEYDRTSGKFDATGHVHVVHGDVLVHADRLNLVYGVDGKPETAVFNGNVTAHQDRNTTLSDTMTYSLSTHRLQANGHVKSTVIQEEKPKPKKTATTDGVMPAAGAAESNDTDKDEEGKDDVVIITSDSQESSKQTGRMSAAGNCHVYYDDIVCAGPACVLINNSAGKADRLIFKGRSQVSQPNKRWIADHIVLTIADKKVLANGNSRAIILQPPPDQQPAPAQTQVAGRPTDRPGVAGTISSTKVEIPK